MKLIHITAKRYPGTTADHNYVLNLAKGFSKILRDKYTFVICNSNRDKLSMGDFKGIDFINLNIPRLVKRTIFFFLYVPILYLKFRKSDAQDKIVFFTNDQNILALLILWKKVLRLSYDVASDWHQLTNTWKDSYIAKNSDHLISTSKKLAKIIERFSTKVNVSTVYGGIDISAYIKIEEDFKKGILNKEKIREMLGLPKDKFLVSYVGLFFTMGMEKGISTMIDSLVNLDDKYTMVFVGGRDKEISFYEHYAESKGVKNRCIFLPIQSFDKVVLYEKAMDTLVIPYPDKPHFREYGFPMKIYEYMASGVPIIYTKLDLLEEVVSDCAYGIIPDSPNDLSSAIINIKNDVSGAMNMAIKAREKVSIMDWNAKAQSIVDKFDILRI